MWRAFPIYLTSLVFLTSLGQQVGPCISNPCGAAVQSKAQIDCSLCNSGSFVLECTCCSLREPPECKRLLNLCNVSQGSCQTSQCAKCCSQDNVPSGSKTCVCLSCGSWMSCKDPDCSGGGTGAYEENGAPPQTLQVSGLPVEFLRDSGGRLRLAGASARVAEDGFHGLELRLDSGSNALAYLILTVELINDAGDSAIVVATVDRTFRPAPLEPGKPLAVPVAASGRARPHKAVVRADYVRFLGGRPEGLYSRSLDEMVRRRKQPFLREIESVLGRLSPGMPAGAARDLLPATDSFAVFRQISQENGVPALIVELQRVRAVLAELGVR